MIRLPTCPICDKALSPDAVEQKKHFPFCSKRCQQVDFFRWLDGRYAIVETLTPDKIPPELLDIDDEPIPGSDG